MLYEVITHAAERRLRRSRDIHREPQPFPAQLRVQPVEHESGLDDREAGFGVELDEPVEVLRIVDHQGGAYRLAALRAARPARQDWNSLVGRDGDRGARRLLAARDDHADRLDLIDRRVVV